MQRARLAAALLRRGALSGGPASSSSSRDAVVAAPAAAAAAARFCSATAPASEEPREPSHGAPSHGRTPFRAYDEWTAKLQALSAARKCVPAARRAGCAMRAATAARRRRGCFACRCAQLHNACRAAVP
jgi:hypothetical protein